VGIALAQLAFYISCKINHIMKRFVLLLTAAGLFTTAFSQQLSKEATYEISKKANKGYLYEPKINEEKKELELTYVTKASGKKAKFETYRFDLDFNFKGMEESEQPLEKIKGYRADKGEEYTLNSMTVETNLMGTLVLRRKIITRKWNWFWGGYDTKIKLADKLKPKTDDGEKLFYFAHTEQDELESVLVIAGAKGPVAKDGLRQYKEIHVMRFDSEMNRISDQTIQFDQPQYIVGISTADNDEEANAEDDILMLFAPMGGKGMKTVADPDSKNYTYVRISYDGKIKERISIKSKAGIFNGNMFVQSGSDVLILGATGADDDYFNEKFSTPQPTSEMRDAQSDEFKAKGFQVVKISNGKVAYVTINTLAEFEAKAKSPASQKKKPEYTGKKFRVSDLKIAPNGDLFLTGQKFQKSKAGYKYEDIIMMHFSPTGTLKAAYGVRREENDKEASMNPNNQMLAFSNDGSVLYWMIMEMAGLKTEKELGESKYKFLIYPSVAKINISNASIGEFVQFGQGKTDYYVNNKYPILPIDKGELVFLGENKSGKTLWFAKMPLD
jgi:hypothetical protein